MSTFDPNKHPRGNAGHAGQFATKAQSDAEVGLGQELSAADFQGRLGKVAAGRWDYVNTPNGRYEDAQMADLTALGELVLAETGQRTNPEAYTDTVETLTTALDVFNDYTPGTTLRRMRPMARRRADAWVRGMVLGDRFTLREARALQLEWDAARAKGVSGVDFVDNHPQGKTRTML